MLGKNHYSFVRGSFPLLVSAFVERNINVNATAYCIRFHVFESKEK